MAKSSRYDDFNILILAIVVFLVVAFSIYLIFGAASSFLKVFTWVFAGICACSGGNILYQISLRDNDPPSINSPNNIISTAMAIGIAEGVIVGLIEAGIAMSTTFWLRFSVNMLINFGIVIAHWSVGIQKSQERQSKVRML